MKKKNAMLEKGHSITTGIHKRDNVNCRNQKGSLRKKNDLGGGSP